MTIQYVLENNDVEYLLKNASNVYPALKRQRLVMNILFVLICLFLTMRLELTTVSARITGFLLILTVGFVSVKTFTWIGRRILMMGSKHPSYRLDLLGEHTLTISGDGVKETSLHREIKETWQGITNIIDTNDYIFMTSASSNVYIIPKRIFQSETGADEFYRLAVDLRVKADMGH